MTSRLRLFAAALLALAPATALADDPQIDVAAADFLDVVETADGSVWKGIVIEQTPNVQYKIATADGSVHVIKAADVVRLTKQRNTMRRQVGFAGGGAGGVGGGAVQGGQYGAQGGGLGTYDR